MDSGHNQQRRVLDSINVIPLKFKHFNSLIELLPNETQYSSLPKISYIAIRNKKTIAVGFLRRIENTKSAVLELYVNEYIGVRLSNQSLLDLSNKLLEEAKDLNIQSIIVSDRTNTILKRLELTKVLLSIGVSYTYALSL